LVVVAFDFDIELQTAIKAAASLYGAADTNFALLGVSSHKKPYAQTVVDESARTVGVKLADPSIPFPDVDAEARYEIWHEAVHCLSPVQRMDTLWFEEGVALRFALKHTPVSRPQRRAFKAAVRPPWRDVLNAFTKLNPTDVQIMEIRKRAPRQQFDTVTADLITEVMGPGIARLATQLCQRLHATNR
jgi:hypothetical protein